MTLSEFKLKTWSAGMAKSSGLDGYSNYGGPTDEEWCDWVVLLGRNRDSELLDESNFECALEDLGGEGKHVQIHRFGHWGCGWFELLLVNPKCASKIKRAFEIHKALQDYPVLDDSDYSERQSEQYSEYAEESKQGLAEAFVKHFGMAMGPKLIEIAYSAQMEDQYNGGEDSCLNIYEFRSPSAHDIKELKSALEGIAYNFKGSKVFKLLVERVSSYEVAKGESHG